MSYSVQKTEAQWQSELNTFEYQVLRLAATERPYTGELLKEERVGSFHCRGCDALLFESGTKFDSHCGWPSFYESKPESIEYIEDRSLGMVRTEVRCAACGSHLGHLFDDAPQTPTGMRYCINSVSMTFREAAKS
jgi:peptide-methionine (R)-S-oxide reductase